MSVLDFWIILLLKAVAEGLSYSIVVSFIGKIATRLDTQCGGVQKTGI